MKMLLIGSLLGVGIAAAANPQARGPLQPGPYTVGFMAGVHYDIGRPPRPEQLARYNMGRAVHISVWYPAHRKANHPPMLFQEYADEIPKMVNPKDVTRRTRSAAISEIYKTIDAFGGDSTIAGKNLGWLMNAETGAYRNASFQGGDFPIVVYPEDPYLGSVLCEYLASYGYVVVSVGTSVVGSSSYVQRVETRVQDYQFALSVIRRTFGIDRMPMAAVERGCTGSAGLAWMMRDNGVEAYVSLGPDPDVQLLKHSPFYDEQSVTKPMLLVHAYGDDSTFSCPRFNGADRYLLSFKTQRSDYYTNVALWGNDFTGQSPSVTSVQAMAYEWMARYTLLFLDWQLKGGYHGKSFFRVASNIREAPLDFSTFEYVTADKPSTVSR